MWKKSKIYVKCEIISFEAREKIKKSGGTAVLVCTALAYRLSANGTSAIFIIIWKKKPRSPSRGHSCTFETICALYAIKRNTLSQCIFFGIESRARAWGIKICERDRVTRDIFKRTNRITVKRPCRLFMYSRSTRWALKYSKTCSINTTRCTRHVNPVVINQFFMWHNSGTCTTH